MAKLKTNEQFIKECIEVHGNKYDYSETFYTGAHNVITIICPIHGSFQQKAYSHVQGCGCLECAGVKKLTTKEFIESAGDPIFIALFSPCGLLVPAMTNITSFSYCILSSIAASGEIKFGFISSFFI